MGRKEKMLFQRNNKMKDVYGGHRVIPERVEFDWKRRSLFLYFLAQRFTSTN